MVEDERRSGREGRRQANGWAAWTCPYATLMVDAPRSATAIFI